MDPLISIIIPNYNHSNFLIQRLESVFNQTFQDFEVILLDDQSTDESITVLERYANHPKVSHFIKNTENSGSPFRQWQKGIQLAKGKYIWIAESDDYCELTFLESLIKMFTANVVIAFCSSINVNQLGEKIGVNQWALSFDRNKFMSNYVNNGKNEVKTHMRYRNCMPNASAVLFKKSAVEDSFFLNFFYFCGDWYFWLKLLQKGDVAYSNVPLNFFRKHAVSTRAVKSYDLEEQRFEEYYSMIRLYSSFWNLSVNHKKYNWIVEEWLYKSSYFNLQQIICIKMPFILKLSFVNKYMKLKFKEKL